MPLLPDPNWFSRVLFTAICLCLLPWTARSAGRGAVRTYRSPEAMYREMLADYRRYAETLWHAAEGEPDMGYWGTGKSDGGNEGVRAITNTALVYATLYADGDRTIPVSRRIDPALRYCAAIYTGGPRKGTDGKQWGGSWQSAMWAGNLGAAALVVRDQLSAETLAAVKKVVAAEADRFIGRMPPDMAPGDTKSEENAWDLMSPAAALALMPDHAHAAAWREALLRYGFNTLSVEADRTSSEIRDGKPLKEWVTTAQLFPDYTLENHGFFHPVYAMVGAATMGHASVLLKMAGQEIPDALRHNVLKEWRTLQYITLSDGEWAYPQGLDWDLHDYEHIQYWAMLATLYGDPAAAMLEHRTATYSRRRQSINGDGRFVGASSNLGFAREAVQAERTAYALWMHRLFSPGGARPPREESLSTMLGALPPVRSFERAGFVLLRAPRGVMTFSWKNRVMGLVIPSSEGHFDQPYVTTPFPESMTGRFSLENEDPKDRDTVTVTRSKVNAGKDRYVVVLDTDLHGGKLRQQMGIAALSSGVMLYLDIVTARRDIVVTGESGLPTGIENDDVTLGKRTVISTVGREEMVAGRQQDHAISGKWANIDDRLGLVAPGGTILYRETGAPNRAGAREDILYGSFRTERRAYRAGEVVARRIGVFLPGATATETAKVSGTATVSRTATGTAIRLADLSGGVHTMLLTATGSVTLDGVTTALP